MVSAGFPDALLQGLITGSIIAAGALSLSLIYSIAEVPNFAHGDMITVGAYLALAVNAPGAIPFLPRMEGVSLALAAVVGLVGAGLLGAAYEFAIFRRFRRRGADLITMVIVSLGLALILRNAVLFLVGSKNIRYTTERVQNTNVDLYAVDAGLTVETTQRRAGDVVVLDQWGYSWLALVAVLAVAVGVGLAVYRWRRTDAEYETVHLVPPAVLGAVALLVALVALLATLGGSTRGTADALYATRVGVSVKNGVILGLTVLAMFAMNVVLKATKLGKAMRATADNMALAEAKGVDVDRVQLVVWVIGGVLTALAGILTGWFASNLNPNMGFGLLLPVFAAVILGGIDSPYGAVVAGLLIGISMDVGVFLLPATFSTYRTAIAFLLLIAVLLVKPEGLWGDV